MRAGNESCMAWSSMTYLTCLVDFWEAWIGLDNLEDYLNYVDYLIWVFMPLIIVFILPFLTVVFLYLSILFLLVYKRKNELKEAYSNSLWDGARKTLATLWDGHATIWHGFKPLIEAFGVIHGPKEECVKALRNGHLLGISPGGLREALFSDETYTIIWGSRKGFAQVAIDAEVPIIPMFTQNIREAYRTLGVLRVFRWLYEKCRLPLVPTYGGFPVKFRTYLGDPIPYVPGITAAELAEKTKSAIQSLIDKHQRIPGNIFQALLERFHRRQKES
ncbi:DGAT1/2-independent enzyme synthesizing storage lipids isoform X2 [Microcaecilia unicolor]|uniref:Transmembrane protein 68 isoform X2 n=1 Tax=Microcaecilia unicolor TaxID=1415580 RepID=A0A6P7Z0R6_9AMPH|nr:transmembrane protein 68 isoform X2 [Microcaecilia unicolor]